jgi:spore coat protein U-like protein
MSISRSFMKKLSVISILGLGAALFQGESAQAATATATLNVSATVVATCLINTTPVNFGSYDGLTGPLNGTGTVSVTCTNGMGWEITLGQGAHPAGGSLDTNPVRRMADNATGLVFLDYGLYTDVGHTINWQNVTGASMPSGSGSGVAQSTTVYGQIPGGQNVATGGYADAVVATVNY